MINKIMTTIIKNKYHLDIPNYPHEIAKFHRTISFHDLSSISITTNTHVPVNYIAFVNDRKFFPHRGSRPEMPCQNTHAIQFYWPLFSTDIIPCARSRSDKLSRITNHTPFFFYLYKCKSDVCKVDNKIIILGIYNNKLNRSNLHALFS